MAVAVEPTLLRFRGGLAGALAPFAVFLAGVAALGFAGAPDERGLWPVLLAAIVVAFLLAEDRDAYGRVLIAGMSQPIVMLMVMAWMLAGALGTLLTAGGLVQGLTGLAAMLGLGGGAFTVAAFLVASAFSTATGTSLGTLVVCMPLLYPAGVAVGAEPLWLAGALLGGATFGDNVSPVSDTTIASAATQGADLGGVVRSRMRYALPAATAALVAYGWIGGTAAGVTTPPPPAELDSLVLVGAPLLVVLMLLRRRHLVESLLAGVVAACALAVLSGRLTAADLLSVDPGAFTARSLLVDGMQRGLGISVFTLLLMGLVAGVEAAGVLDRLVGHAARSSSGPRAAETWIVLTVSAAVWITTHSVVAILATGAFARATGERHGIGPYRRANLLDTTVCTWPFLLPWFIPTILAASLTSSVDAPRLSALQIGLANLHSWALLAVVAVAVLFGYGRRRGA